NLDELRFLGGAAEVPTDAFGDRAAVLLQRCLEALQLLPAVGGGGAGDGPPRGGLQVEEPANLRAPLLRRSDVDGLSHGWTRSWRMWGDAARAVGSLIPPPARPGS